MLYMKHTKMGGSNKDKFYGEAYGRTIPRLEMIDVNMTIMEIKK